MRCEGSPLGNIVGGRRNLCVRKHHYYKYIITQKGVVKWQNHQEL